MSARSYVALMAEQVQLEVAAEQNGCDQKVAIAEMGRAIREHGEKSREAIEAEAKADALFERGEDIAARLLVIAKQLGEDCGVEGQAAA